jgi:glycosyltransferase involved in cell wall biosynthesis
MDVIKAFQMAFQANEDVRLFIKASKFSLNNPDSMALVEAAKIDARIALKEGHLNTFEYEEFIDAMHVLISLHRTEGFGRVIGEALIMNKLVISSRYGGVMDYLSETNAILVDGVLGEITENEYFCWKGNKWFYPDMQDAVDKIKFSYSNYLDFQKNLHKFKDEFEGKYSIKIIEKNKSYIYD